jgi:hypothetical protein
MVLDCDAKSYPRLFKFCVPLSDLGYAPHLRLGLGALLPRISRLPTFEAPIQYPGTCLTFLGFLNNPSLLCICFCSSLVKFFFINAILALPTPRMPRPVSTHAFLPLLRGEPQSPMMTD